ncbi:hypothetical protein ACP26L_05690 [Paenibacillus sp. S-38]
MCFLVSGTADEKGGRLPGGASLCTTWEWESRDGQTGRPLV